MELQLSKRELEVLLLLVEGLMYKQIVVELGITMDTVKKHCKNIYKKTKLKNRSELAAFYYKNQSQFIYTNPTKQKAL